MEYEKVTETIIGCAYRVYNKMGFGFLESVQEKCLPCEIHVSDSEAYFIGEVQMVNYLVATGRPVGLILNFGERKVEIKRKVKDLN